MIEIAIFLFVIAIIGLVFIWWLNKQIKIADRDDTLDLVLWKKITKLIVAILLIISLVLTIFSCTATVTAGHIGVVDTFGDVSPTLLNPGVSLKNPFAGVVELSTQTMELKESSSVPSKEGLIVALDISVLYRIQSDKADEIYKTIGVGYCDVVIVPQLRSIVREITAMFEAKALYTEARENITLLIYEKLQPFLLERGIILEKVLLRDLTLPSTVTTAIEMKLKAEQEAQQMQFVLQKETLEAERKVIEAKGISEAQTIIHQSLTAEYLRWYWITHLKDYAAIYYVPIGNDGYPIMNIPVTGNK